MAYTKPNIGTLNSLSQDSGSIKLNTSPKFDISLTPSQVSDKIRKDISFNKNIQDQANVIKSLFK
jgi:hypothetical protein